MTPMIIDTDKSHDLLGDHRHRRIEVVVLV